MLRTFFLIWVTLAGVGGSAFAEKKFYIAPDHFEIEVTGNVPSLRITQDRFGTTASFTLVAAYDVALTAIGYANRDTAGDVEIVRLPIDVQDFVLSSRFVSHSPAVRGAEKERGRDRVAVRVRFSNDIAPEQARLMLSANRVYGTVKGRIAAAEGVPTSLRNVELEGVPACNQFQQTTDGEIKIARNKYAALNQYKAEKMAELAGKLAAGADLDRSVRESLMAGEKEFRLSCRRGLGSYDDWACRIILEYSTKGSLNEAIFALASRVFPTKIVSEEPSRYVYDSFGTPVKWKALGVPSVPHLPGQSEFERILAMRSNPSMDESQYRMQLYRYALNLYYFTPDRDVDRAVDFLLSIRSLEEESAATKALMAVVFHSTERKRSSPERVSLTLATIQRGRGPATEIERVMEEKHRLGAEAYESELKAYFARNFRHFTEEQHAESAKVMTSFQSIAASGIYNRRVIGRLFLEIETQVAPPSADSEPTSDIDRILRSAKDPGVTEAELVRRLDAYVAKLYPSSTLEERRRIGKCLRTLYDENDHRHLDAERRMFRDVLKLIEDIEKDEKP